MKKLSANEFLLIVSEYEIDPAVALENENVVQALKNCSRTELRKVLSEEF